MKENAKRREYTRPAVEDFGTVTDLTATGTTQTGSDAKGGSVASMGV